MYKCNQCGKKIADDAIHYRGKVWCKDCFHLIEIAESPPDLATIAADILVELRKQTMLNAISITAEIQKVEHMGVISISDKDKKLECIQAIILMGDTNKDDDSTTNNTTKDETKE